jgi:restriction system protein
MTAKIGQLQTNVSARGYVSYWVEMRHEGLHKYRLVRGPDEQVVLAVARVQAADWDDRWTKQAASTAAVVHMMRQKEEAAGRTTEAQRAQQALQSILPSSLADSKVVDWEALKDHTPFPQPPPKVPKQSSPPDPGQVPDAPDRGAPRYQPKLGLLDKLIRSRRIRKQSLADEAFETAAREWEAERDRALAEHTTNMEVHQRQLADLETAYRRRVQEWEADRAAFTARQAEQHAAIDAFRKRYHERDRAAVAQYCDMVLASSEYPECLPKELDLDLNPDTGVLVVNYKLPAPSNIPTLSEVKYLQSSGTFSEKHLSEANAAKLYDGVIYQIALRTVNELLEADQAAALTSVVFNGYVKAVDKGTGKEVTACIISVQASKDALRAMDLSRVDPKACFRQLKGVGSSKLHSITPVAPIIDLRREDDRFIPSYGVAERLNAGFNLAAMDWEDFEHLIREIFEKEFTSTGGEVRVTQASRDGGVDAVAFDPDPIRGGKIVIQAKRYAYTVGVSSARPLRNPHERGGHKRDSGHHLGLRAGRLRICEWKAHHPSERIESAASLGEAWHEGSHQSRRGPAGRGESCHERNLMGNSRSVARRKAGLGLGLDDG